MAPMPLSSLTTPAVLFVIALLVRAIFAFLETSITAMRLFKLKEIATEAPGYETLFTALEKTPHYVIITTLIASSLADVTSAALATYIMETIFAHMHLSSGLGFSLGIGIASILIIIFGEIIPKNLAKSRGEHYFRNMLWLINLVYYALYPLVVVLVKFSDATINAFGGHKTPGESGEWVSSEREIRFLIDYIHDKGLMDAEKTEMLRSIFDLGHKPVKDVMVPAPDIESVSIDTPIPQLLEEFSKHQYTRLPVYQTTPDNIIGMVHQKDLFVMLSHREDKTLRDIMRPIMFVPESVKINQLLREFRQEQMHIAIVLNEHGIVTGLITLEDILEEIVGEISDEHESETMSKITLLPQGGWIVDASIPLEELTETIGITFETEWSGTLGGFIIERLHHLPHQGEQLIYKKFTFQVHKATPKRVHQVMIFETK